MYLKIINATLLLTIIFSNPVFAGKVIGHISPITNNIVKGWACETSVNRSIEVILYAGNHSGNNLRYIKKVLANKNSEAAVRSACKTSGVMHRFSVELSQHDLRRFEGKKLFINGLSVTGTPNFKITKSGSYTIPSPSVNLVSRKLLKDQHFRNGFEFVRAKKPSEARNASVAVKIPNRLQRPEDYQTAPSWILSEWYTRQLLPMRGTYDDNSKEYFWKNRYKKISVDLRSRELTFTINTEADYSSRYRKASDKWVHLLISQRISKARNTAHQSASISSMNKLVLNVEAKLDYEKQIVRPGYNSNIHAQQFVLFFTVQNLNQQSEGFGEFVWIGVTLYDNRTAFPRGARHIDRSSGSLIYGMNYRDHSNVSLHSKRWVNVNHDILPHIKEALNYGFSNNVFKSRNLSDYKIGGMNTGYETTGRHITTVRIKNLQLTEFTPQN